MFGGSWEVGGDVWGKLGSRVRGGGAITAHIPGRHPLFICLRNYPLCSSVD